MKTITPWIFIGMFTPVLWAQEAADASAKLREQLRATVTQLRAVQSEAANAQAAQIAAETQNKQLLAKLEALEKSNAALVAKHSQEKVTAEQTIAKLNNKVTEREKRIADYVAALEKWKAGYAQAANIAREKDEKSQTLATQLIEQQRLVADRERKNLALFHTANEILTRFEGYSLGKAIAAKEPFIGTSRVKIESLVEGYKDKILDQRLEKKTP